MTFPKVFLDVYGVKGNVKNSPENAIFRKIVIISQPITDYFVKMGEYHLKQQKMQKIVTKI